MYMIHKCSYIDTSKDKFQIFKYPAIYTVLSKIRKIPCMVQLRGYRIKISFVRQNPTFIYTYSNIHPRNFRYELFFFFMETYWVRFVQVEFLMRSH